MPTPPEGAPQPAGVTDRDFFFHLTPGDREKLREALANHDYATFNLWFERSKRALRDDPRALAEFYANAAIIADSANKPEIALKYAVDAAQQVLENEGGSEEQKLERNIISFLAKVGGTAAVNKALGSAIATTQNELFRIQDYGYLKALQKQGEEAVRKNDAQIARLKARNQRLSNLKIAFAK